jgi:integrase
MCSTSVAPAESRARGAGAGRRFAFTAAALAKLKCPAGSDRLYVYDQRTPGLALCVTAAGARTFYVYRRVDGRPQRVRVGRFPGLSIEQARRQAAQVNAAIARGEDPQAERRRRRVESTVGELFAHFLEAHAKLHKKSWRQDQDQYDLYLSDWKSRRLSAVRRADVAALHAKVGRERGHYAANRLLSLLSSMFAKARDLGHAGENPARGVKRFKETTRDRFLRADELPRFFAALDAEPSHTIRDFFYLALLTGARRSNVQTMRWADVSLDGETWRLPETKGGEPLTVPLVPAAVRILRQRWADAIVKAAADAGRGVGDGEPGPYVFPGRGGDGHLTEPNKAWASLLKRAKISDLRIHDLRRTLGSWQAAGGSSLTIIGKSLGHKNPNTTAIYARLQLDPVRQSVAAAASAILAAGNVAAPAEAPRTAG